MNIFGVGLPEIAVISALALIIFGPKRLPELGRSLGKTLRGLQTASTQFEQEIQKAMSEEDSLEEKTSTGDSKMKELKMPIKLNGFLNVFWRIVTLFSFELIAWCLHTANGAWPHSAR